ncbi:hypothetical protein [Lacisediminimonas profundi]|uniref:hypothetical protein n=1 Tax=Lacisediminimonas profundi TaxID=2603856 RepID=UPI00124BA24C|nr:hypothetical protein [Lacisediminimonas profundi]
MYYKKPSGDYFELVAVTRIYVLARIPDGDLEVRMELADGVTLDRMYSRLEYSEMMVSPPDVIV